MSSPLDDVGIFVAEWDLPRQILGSLALAPYGLRISVLGIGARINHDMTCEFSWDYCQFEHPTHTNIRRVHRRVSLSVS